MPVFPACFRRSMIFTVFYCLGSPGKNCRLKNNLINIIVELPYLNLKSLSARRHTRPGHLSSIWVGLRLSGVLHPTSASRLCSVPPPPFVATSFSGGLFFFSLLVPIPGQQRSHVSVLFSAHALSSSIFSSSLHHLSSLPLPSRELLCL